MSVGTADTSLAPNSAAAEVPGEYLSPTSTGFQITTTNANFNTSGASYIYMAIRRGPMRVPTTGTSVFTPLAVTNTTGTTNTTGFPVDLQMQFYRPGGLGFSTSQWIDGLRGISSTSSVGGVKLFPSVTDAETTGAIGTSFSNTGFNTGSGWNNAPMSYQNFRRAPGYFDEVCYNGNGDEQFVKHNLTVPPELMIVKRRNSTADWYVYSASTTSIRYLVLNTTAASVSDFLIWAAVTPTSADFTVYQPGIGEIYDVNKTGGTYVAYLFATCPGVSKVGSFTGTGAPQVINCGFTGGARFVLIKATSTTGDWYVWDSARGIVAGNDPYLELNTADAEVTTTDWVDTAATGFELSNAGGNLANSNGVSYIFLAIA